MNPIALIVAGFGLAATLSAPAGAAPIAGLRGDAVAVASSNIVTVSGGCGPNAWRGPWGHCRDTVSYTHLTLPTN